MYNKASFDEDKNTHRGWIMKQATCLFVAVVVGLYFTSSIHAEDFSTALSKTLSEIPSGADEASGIPSTAALDFSSKNPAIIAAGTASGTEPKSKVGATINYGFISFKNGLDVNTGSMSGTVKMPVGVAQLTISDGRSNTGDIDEYSDIKFNSFPSAELQYGLKVADSLYAGVSYTYSQSKITSNMTMEDEASGEPYNLSLTSKEKSNELGAGILYRLGKLNLGAFYGHSWDQSRNYVDGTLESTDNSKTDQLRLGASIQILPTTMLAMDYRYFWFPDSIHDAQYFAGVEQYVYKDIIALYGGYANGGAATGLGVYFENGGLNLAYMYRPFRSTEKYLGKAEVLEVLLYLNF